MSTDLTISALVAAGVNLATLPLDYSKVQAQVRYMNHKVETPRPLLFAREVVSVKGLSGVFVGSGTMGARAVLYSLLRFGIYSPLANNSASKDRYNTTTITARTFYSGLASAVAGFALTPLDLVLVRQQTDNLLSSPRGYRGMIDGLQKASLPSAGQLYTAATMNALKWGVFASTMMSVYDYFSEFWPRVQGEFFLNKSLSVLTATLFATLFAMPFDNIKTKLQHQTTDYYKSGADCFKKSCTREGFMGLYVGYWHYYARTSVIGISSIYLIDYLRNLSHGA